MKLLFAIITLSLTLMTTSCYSNATKESGTEETAQTTPLSRPASVRF